MPFCHNCGTQINELNKFCNNCGTKIIGFEGPSLSSPSTEKEKKGGNWKELFISVGISPLKAYEYEQIFIKHGIDQTLLDQLDMQLLERLGISLMGDRLKILKLQKNPKSSITTNPKPPPPSIPRTSSRPQTPQNSQPPHFQHSSVSSLPQHSSMSSLLQYSNSSSNSLSQHNSVSSPPQHNSMSSQHSSMSSLPQTSSITSIPQISQHNKSSYTVSQKNPSLSKNPPRATMVPSEPPPFFKQNSLPSGFHVRAKNDESPSVNQQNSSTSTFPNPLLINNNSNSTSNSNHSSLNAAINNAPTLNSQSDTSVLSRFSKIPFNPFNSLTKFPSNDDIKPYCGVCAEPISGSSLVAFGRTYHSTCFTCYICGQQLNPLSAKFKGDGKIFCEKDFSADWSQATPSQEDSRSPFSLLSDTQKNELIKDAQRKNPAEGSWGRLILAPSSSIKFDFFDIKGEFVFGRNASCDLSVNDALISGKHFRIFTRPSKQVDGLTEPCIEDLSTNGTYLQGMKLGPGRVVPLNDRDEIRIDIRLNESKTEATDAIHFILQLINATRKWRQRYDSVSSKIDEVSKQRSSTLRKPKLEREDTMRLPLGVIHANSFTEEEIEKYKREQIEKYERQQKENQELLQQIREGKTSPTFVAEKRPSISEERGTFVQTINQGIQDATEEQKKEKNEKLKTQILFLQKSVDANIAENDQIRNKIAEVKQIIDRLLEERKHLDKMFAQEKF